MTESLDEFKNSFFYGSRSDLNAKFLAELSSEQAGEFLAEMLALIARMIDDGDAQPVIDRFIEWQCRAYTGHLDRKVKFAYSDTPFTPLTRPLAQSRVALITSSGHFVEGDDPQPFGEVAMTQAEAEARIGEFLQTPPTLSQIPIDVAPEKLRARHGGYPIAAVLADHQVALPLRHMSDAAACGLIGEVAPVAYSFVGATSQLRLRDQVAPEWTEMLRAAEVDLVLLVPV